MSNTRKKRVKKRSTSRRTFDRDLAWLAIRSSIVGSMITPQNEKGHMALILKGYAALAALESGYLDHEGYYMLNFMNTLFFCLSVTVNEQGSEAVKDAMQKNMQLTYAVSDTLVAINERHTRIKRYGGTGEQLQLVRAMITALDRLAEAAPVGVVLKSIQAAQDMIDRYLGKKTRAA